MLLLASALAAAPPVSEEPPVWEATLERAVKGIVAIRLSSTRAFDTENASSSVATGFVVDAKRGIILTNRHVVTPGPVVAEAVFLKHEEIALTPIYRDPVHDFGFYQYDPAALQYTEVAELALEPAHARVGVELRVAGNDAGEKLSILSGTLARVDRDAPIYGDNNFNDFNTFYYQAASGTSGGSSGSPVLDVHGHVIALNAGGSRSAASSFYLPLDRVVRALDRVRAGQPVTRGTLEAVFTYKPYDEVLRLGTRAETEKAVRAAFPDGTGMLVATEVLAGGPAAGKLEPGDVLVRVNGKLMTRFIPLEAVLDDGVGQEVSVEVERGGRPLTVTIEVEDLHAITPASYLEVGGGVLHALSFQQARNHAVPVAGIYVADGGEMFSGAGVPEGAVITEVAGIPVPTLEALESALATHPHGARVPIRYFDLRNPRRSQVAVPTVDRRWFPMQLCRRDDTTGRWPCTPSPAPPAPPAVEPRSTVAPFARGSAARALATSFVWVEDVVRYRTEGVYGARFKGTGLVIDAERGLVLVDRDTVPVLLGDVRVTFNGVLDVPAKVVWLHPLHNLAVIRYDPAAIGDTPVKSANLATWRPKLGDATFLVGQNGRQEVMQVATQVKQFEAMLLPIPAQPFFRDTSLQVVQIGDAATSIVGGVLADKRGNVQALWASFVADGKDKPTGFFRAIPESTLRDVIEPMRKGGLPKLRGLGAELVPVTLATARDLGLPDAESALLAGHSPQLRQVLLVTRLIAGTPAATVLREGDLLLSANGRPVTGFREVERAAQAEQLPMRVYRDGRTLSVVVPTFALDGSGLGHAALWAGALLHDPHLSVAAQRGFAPEGVYVARSWYGSPAPRYGLRPTMRITAVDGAPVRDLAAFLTAVAGRPNRGAIRLQVVDLDGRVQVITLKLDLDYWPTEELVYADGEWERRAVRQ